MRHVSIIFIVLLFSSCAQEKQEVIETPVSIVDIKFPETKIALVGNTTQLISSWEEYTAVVVGFENYDHSESATQRLVTLVNTMGRTIPPDFDNQAIRSRIMVLETRLNRYASFLGYSYKTEEKYLQYYTDIVEALDHLNGQLNEKALVDKMEQELMEELKADLRDLNAVETDSIP